MRGVAGPSDIQSSYMRLLRHFQYPMIERLNALEYLGNYIHMYLGVRDAIYQVTEDWSEYPYMVETATEILEKYSPGYVERERKRKEKEVIE